VNGQLIACPGERVRKPRGANRFKQRDVQRALRAARGAGFDVAGFRIDADGRIEVIFGGAQPSSVDAAASAYDEWRKSCGLN
jgi:hypothetical protein